MADFGFYVENDNNEVLLNDYHDFFRFVESGQSSTPNDTAPPHVDINFGVAIPIGEPLILAVRCDQIGVGMVFFKEDGSGNLTGAMFYVEPGISQRVDYQLFARYAWNLSPDTDADYGLQVFGPKPDNRLLYDSRVAELQIVDSVQIGMSAGSTKSHTSMPGAHYDIPSLNHKLAYVPTAWTGGGEVAYLYWYTYKQVSNTTLEVQEHYFNTGQNSIGLVEWNTSSDGKCVIVDHNLYY